MVVLDSSGYCRTGRAENARKPISRISRLTTVARTGRRMKRSVKRMASGPGSVGRNLVGCLQRLGLDDGDDRSRPELQLARGSDDIARTDAGEDRHLIVETRTGLDEHPGRFHHRLALVIGSVLLDREDRI